MDPELTQPASKPPTGVAVVTVGDLLRWYLRTFEKKYKWARSKSDHLRFLTSLSVAQLDAATLTADELVRCVWQRRAMGASVATAVSDLSRISVVLKAAKQAGGTSVHPAIVEEALSISRETGLLARSAKRMRRPTPSELVLLDRFFRSRSRGEIPMRDIVSFAIHSARQENEICQLKWSDLDPETHTGSLRIVGKQGAGTQQTRFQLPEAAWIIAQRQPRTDSRIFPYHPQSVGKAFRVACQTLGIDNLNFRDLHFEAVLRLFEKGLSIYQVSEITLIRSQSTLLSFSRMITPSGGQQTAE
jgi:integrase